MEHKTAQSWNRARRELSRGARTASGRARTGSARLGRREKQRLLQLGVCIALFLVVFIGKGVFPEQISLLREAGGEMCFTSYPKDADFFDRLWQLILEALETAERPVHG